jgi:SRSO17 transposase
VKYDVEIKAQHRLDEYLAKIGEILGHKKRRASFALYFLGLLCESERKSMEPIAARLCPDPEEVSAVHQQLQHFVTDSDWNDRAVRRVAARHAIAAMSEREPVRLWIIDDTGFIKQGEHSVGVQRQYTGTAGKVTNCQVGVSLSVATSTAHAPIDFELYLPESWANDPGRRAEAKIPVEVVFKTKPQLAIDMIVRALEDDLPGEIVLADGDYGDRPFFRDTVRAVGLDYAVGVHKTTRVRFADKRGRPYGPERTVHQLATDLGASAFQRITWREGTAGDLSSRFALRRVKEMHGKDIDVREREAEWLLIEWRGGEPEPAKYSLSTLPSTMPLTQLVRLLKERYRTERAYQELKGELRLDHFEGRRFRGWHHHVSVALCCYAFVIAERVRHFPPSAARSADHDTHRLAA